QQNRVFLDFFWDLAKPDQEVRLKAVENLIQYLKTNNKVLSAFEDVSLQSILNSIKEKHNLQGAKKKFARNAMFGNLFGVLALHQSNRLSKQEPQVVLGCVQLLQSLSQHKQHLKDLPTKTMMDILTEVPEEVFEEVLMGALQTDLESAFRTPEQLQLLLVALQRFPQTLKPKKLKKLLGSSTIINADNIPITEVLKTAAHAVKKERILPAVVLDLLKLSLKEDSFELFWNKAITDGMLKEQPGPTYMSFRLLGSALPLLSAAQLKDVLSGEVMINYGEHVVSAQPDRFKLAPEMDVFVSDFLEGCRDSDKQLAVMVGFSSLTNRGYPVVPSVWKVVQHLQPAALQGYVEWLKDIFLQPQLDKLLDISTQKKKDSKGGQDKEESVFRLRKWIVSRLASIIDNHQVKKQEDLVMDVAFVFFHAFFSAKKASADISETKTKLSVPIDDKTRAVLVNSFFVSQKRVLGVTADGTMWIYHLVQYAQALLNQPKHVQSSQPFSPEQRQAWDMLESVANLKKKAKKSQTAESSAFQQLFLLVGMHLFKAPEELLDIMKDLQSCMEKAQEKKAKKKKKKETEQEEPEWVEVMVDILLSLLSQQSRHIRQVCKTVFSSICPHVTAAALTAILDDDKSDESDDDDDDDDDDGDEEEEGEDEKMDEEPVDQNFRIELMKVLQQKNALATEEDASSDEDLDDEAMMELDKSLSALFSEQKKKLQAKKDEKTKLQKEKTLVREFKIKVLDLIEVFVARQAGSPLVLGLVEPLLAIIERGMSSGSDQQEQDFLRRTADIFNHLCRSKVYCRTAGDRQGELHDLLEKLVTKSQKLSDSSVSLYYFASLYVVKLKFMGNVDVDRVSTIFRDALCSFMSRRKSPLTAQMFIDLFVRFPVLCVKLLDTAVQNITSGVREHQQESKVVKEKAVKTLELCQFIVKHVRQQKLSVDLEPLQQVLQSLTSVIAFKKTGKLEDTYWAVMKHFGV
uniref:MYB binding protein (P160) 1a n=1 Tax=Neolamprologus brichardi TaxID=32507 RepID=A0A3Q4GSP4_NEOBR